MSFSLVNTNMITGRLPLDNFVQASTGSLLFGRGSGSGVGNFQEISIGNGLSMSGVALVATSTSSSINSIDKDASEFIPRTTSGCGVDSTQLNTINLDWLTFDAATQEYAQVWFNWPDGWNTAKTTIYWQASAASGSAVWGVGMRSFADGDSLSTTVSGHKEVTDAVGSSGTMRQTTAITGITPNGTISGGNRTVIELYRNASSVSDDLAVDAYFAGMRIEKDV